MRLIAAVSLAALLAAAGSSAPLAAQAQDGGTEKVNALIVYGEDPCPQSTGDEITVCARKPEAERFRIPQGLRQTPSATSEAWNNKVVAYETVGRTGTQSCSPVGPGGWTGCSSKLIDAAYAEKKLGNDVQFAKIIEDERAKRNATVDAEAAATQARVEEAEKQHEARQRAEAEGAPQPAPSPSPTGN